jgi:hypothetical protein
MRNYRLTTEDIKQADGIFVWNQQLRGYIKGRKKDIQEALEMGIEIRDYKKSFDSSITKLIFIR